MEHIKPTLQHESHTRHVITLGADARWLPPTDGVSPDTAGTIHELELIIDGNQLRAGHTPASLLADSTSHLPRSIRFKLRKMETTSDGRCRLLYERL